MVDVYINKIATAVPDHDVHRKFVEFAPSLLKNERERSLLKRMADKAQIEHRYSFLRPHPEGKGFDADGFYQPGAFPDTQKRMRFYEQHALGLAIRTLDQINFAEHRDSITHVIITTCTGFYAPGHPGGRTILDAVQKSIGLPPEMLRQSRDVLRRFGNMSSATVMFVLKEMLDPGVKAGRGCAMAFGPGITAESMLFQTSGA